MMEMSMAEQVVKGVAKKLSKFELPVYVDEVKSNLQYPCFIVLAVEQRHRRLPSNRLHDLIPIQVVYIPSSDNNGVNFEMFKVADNLNLTLDVIELPDGTLVPGFNRYADSYRDTMFYNVDYEVERRIIEDKVPMTELEVERGDIKDD